MEKIVGKSLPSLLCLSVVALLFASQLAAGPPGPGGHGGGGGGGGHNGGGGWGGGGGGHNGGGGWSGGGGGHNGGGGWSGGAAHQGHAGPAHGSPYVGHAGHPGHSVGPMAYHHGHFGHWYHGDWHDHYHWNHPWHFGPVAWWSAGFVTGAIVWEAPWRWGYWPYYNPYFTEVVVIDNTTVDYSRPIVVAPAAPAASQQQADAQTAQSLDAARTYFASGDYASAMTQVNQAITQTPNDTVPHEFRALVLFATKRYKEAAATVYAVLSVGPGWDWTTLSSFYPDVNVYTAQLRALEQYRDANLKSPDVRFLLAYHYMSCGHRDAAVTELKEVVKLSPKDQLSAQMLAALSQNAADIKPTLGAVPAAPAAPAKPVDAASLVGSWEATRSDGASFSLEIAKDGTYSWRHTLQGQSQTFSGAYTVADNLLILKEGGNPAMIGQVTLLDARRFSFKIVGGGASDAGLTFSKK
jgi:hypothetical protein